MQSVLILSPIPPIHLKCHSRQKCVTYPTCPSYQLYGYPHCSFGCSLSTFNIYNYPIYPFLSFLDPVYIVELQLVVENVCESEGPAMVCVQLKTNTEREVTATVQTSDLSARSELCMHTFFTCYSILCASQYYGSFYCVIALSVTIISLILPNRWIRLHYFHSDLQFPQPISC